MIQNYDVTNVSCLFKQKLLFDFLIGKFKPLTFTCSYIYKLKQLFMTSNKSIYWHLKKERKKLSSCFNTCSGIKNKIFFVKNIKMYLYFIHMYTCISESLKYI
ncbi:hypothetical protein KUTeg_024714 [Tegillarca granosa]|uniref:Uncharacterized protein n=1 Tax=Tegillarca granosa TaxID=220873 RepID=A0ABQ9E4E0_TEGGR|nr:hypothetical protein KUTeg_024714 [Tegillarca granosa]